MPTVNAELMFQAMKEASADFNQIVCFRPEVDHQFGVRLGSPVSFDALSSAVSCRNDKGRARRSSQS